MLGLLREELGDGSQRPVSQTDVQAYGYFAQDAGSLAYSTRSPRRLAKFLLSELPFSAVKPHVTAYKKSEHGNEGDTGILICKCNSYPPVSQWTWYKIQDGVNEVSILGDLSSRRSGGEAG